MTECEAQGHCNKVFIEGTGLLFGLPLDCLIGTEELPCATFTEYERNAHHQTWIHREMTSHASVRPYCEYLQAAVVIEHDVSLSGSHDQHVNKIHLPVEHAQSSALMG